MRAAELRGPAHDMGDEAEDKDEQDRERPALQQLLLSPLKRATVEDNGEMDTMRWKKRRFTARTVAIVIVVMTMMMMMDG
jgi:hypothetical protein